jgi:HEAT repeat protein
VKKLTAVFFSVVLVGLSPVPTYAQGKSKGGGSAFPGGIDGRSVEPLRIEIARLHQELETAVKAIKRLQTVQDKADADAGPRYQGWPARLWIKQLEDLDPNYRLEAIKALGILAKKNKDLIPVLLASLKDESDEVGQWGAYVLSGFGEEVTPSLVKILKDKTSVTAQIHAAYALGLTDPRPKTAVPALVEALKENDWNLRKAAVKALGEIGPDAKPALPTMADVYRQFLKKMNKDAAARSEKSPSVFSRRNNNGASDDEFAAIAMLRSMVKIDPKACVPSLILTLAQNDSEYVVSSAVKTLGDIGPGAKAAFPIIVGVFEASLKEIKRV